MINISDKMNLKKSSGFTLIELVIVVVILGFLAVTAIPKFLDLTEQAKQANIEGMAGGFATGVSLVRAQWEAEGRPTANNVNRVNYDGSILYLTTRPNANPNNIRPGYPTGLDQNNADGTAMTTADCIDVWEVIFSQPPSISDVIGDLNNDNLNIDYFVIVNNNLCGYFLKETLTQDGSGNYVAPVDENIGNNFFYDNSDSSVVVKINNLP